MPSRSQDQPLAPHPLVKAVAGRDLRNIAIIEAIVCSNAGGKVELAPDIGSLSVRLTVGERDILYTEPVAGETGRYQFVIAGDAEVSLVSTQKLKASDIDGSEGPEPSSGVMMMQINDSGGTTGEVNCVTACARAKRRCEGLFPTKARKAQCQKDYDACIKKCSSAGVGGGGIFIA